MKKMYRFHWDCGRMGEVRSVFVAEEEKVQAALGKGVYFGEILGKHSEVHGTLVEGDLEVLTDDQDFIDKATRYGISSVGYNPLDYLEEEPEPQPRTPERERGERFRQQLDAIAAIRRQEEG